MGDRQLSRRASTLGGRLSIAREVCDVTQDIVAAALRTSVSEVSKWENNKQVPSVDNLRVLSTVLGVSADWLVHGPRYYDIHTLQPITPGAGRHPATREEERDALDREVHEKEAKTRKRTRRIRRRAAPPEATDRPTNELRG